jgi:hypothetical protein
MGNFKLFNTPAWTNNGTGDPVIFHNSTGVGFLDLSDNYEAVNAVLMGPFHGPSVVQWTAPAYGIVDLESSGENIQSCCGTRAVNFDVLYNNTVEFSENIPGLPTVPADPTAPGAFPTATFDPAAFFVTEGETISFVAYNGGGGDNNTMQLNADIAFTPVPEPSSVVALCGLGAAGLVLVVRRRRRSK